MKKTNQSDMKLSARENSISHALDPIMPELYKCTSIPELYNMVDTATKDIKGEKTTSKRDELLSGIKNARSFTRAISYVYNFYLKGDGMGTLKF